MANLLGKYRVYQGVSISELPCTMTIGIAYVQLNSQSWYNGTTVTVENLHVYFGGMATGRLGCKTDEMID